MKLIFIPLRSACGEIYYWRVKNNAIVPQSEAGYENRNPADGVRGCEHGIRRQHEIEYRSNVRMGVLLGMRRRRRCGTHCFSLNVTGEFAVNGRNLRTILHRKPRLC